MRYLFIILFLHLVSISKAQNLAKRVDSMLQVAKASNDSVQLRIYNQAAFYYIFNNPTKAKEILTKGIKKSKQVSSAFSEAELTNTLGIYYDVSGKPDSAKYYFKKAFNVSKDNNLKIIEVMVINNLGMFHWNKGQYQEALDYFFQALAMNAEMKTKNKEETYLNNIGLIYQEMKQYDKALNYHKRALVLRRKNNDSTAIPASLNNLAIAQTYKGDYAKAEQNLLECLTISKKVNELGVYCNCLNSLSDLYLKTNKYFKTIPLLKEAIAIRNKNNIDRRANLSSIANIIQVYYETNQPKKAIPFIKQGLAFLNEFSDLKIDAVDFYKNAAYIYFLENNITQGEKYLNQALTVKDSIFSKQNAENLATLETKFETEKKERDLAQTRATLAEKELEVERKNKFLYGSLGFAFLLGLIGYLLYNQQKLKNNQLQKENELKEALARIETQNKLQEQRLRISRDLHDNIGSQLTFITSSLDNLNYKIGAEDKQVSNKINQISEFTTQTIYELRDTIWAMNKEWITLEDLQTRISNFIEKANQASNLVSFNFKIVNNTSRQVKISSLKGINIYRIIQESVNNALKHAQAKEIEVKLIINENNCTITIQDDGKGFDIHNINLGNGIYNIKKRAREINGNLKIASQINKGTKITLIFS